MYIGARDYNNRVYNAAKSLPSNPTPEQVDKAAGDYGVDPKRVSDLRGASVAFDRPREDYVASPNESRPLSTWAKTRQQQLDAIRQRRPMVAQPSEAAKRRATMRAGGDPDEIPYTYQQPSYRFVQKLNEANRWVKSQNERAPISSQYRSMTNKQAAQQYYSDYNKQELPLYGGLVSISKPPVRQWSTPGGRIGARQDPALLPKKEARWKYSYPAMVVMGSEITKGMGDTVKSIKENPLETAGTALLILGVSAIHPVGGYMLAAGLTGKAYVDYRQAGLTPGQSVQRVVGGTALTLGSAKVIGLGIKGSKAIIQKMPKIQFTDTIATKPMISLKIKYSGSFREARLNYLRATIPIEAAVLKATRFMRSKPLYREGSFRGSAISARDFVLYQQGLRIRSTPGLLPAAKVPLRYAATYTRSGITSIKGMLPSTVPLQRSFRLGMSKASVPFRWAMTKSMRGYNFVNARLQRASLRVNYFSAYRKLSTRGAGVRAPAVKLALKRFLAARDRKPRMSKTKPIIIRMPEPTGSMRESGSISSTGQVSMLQMPQQKSLAGAIAARPGARGRGISMPSISIPEYIAIAPMINVGARGSLKPFTGLKPSMQPIINIRQNLRPDVSFRAYQPISAKVTPRSADLNIQIPGISPIQSLRPIQGQIPAQVPISRTRPRTVPDTVQRPLPPRMPPISFNINADIFRRTRKRRGAYYPRTFKYTASIAPAQLRIYGPKPARLSGLERRFLIRPLNFKMQRRKRRR
jgi:hypothetical protein